MAAVAAAGHAVADGDAMVVVATADLLHVMSMMQVGMLHAELHCWHCVAPLG